MLVTVNNASMSLLGGNGALSCACAYSCIH